MNIPKISKQADIIYRRFCNPLQKTFLFIWDTQYFTLHMGYM